MKKHDHLSVKDIHLRYGIPLPTVKKWSTSGDLVPDSRISDGNTPVFHVPTVEAFLRGRGRLSE